MKDEVDPSVHNNRVELFKLSKNSPRFSYLHKKPSTENKINDSFLITNQVLLLDCMPT